VKRILDIGILPEVIAEAHNVVLICHFNPDGDAIGSICGGWHYLTQCGISANVVLPSIYPDNLAFLLPEGHSYIYKEQPSESARVIGEADTIICCDFNTLSRTEYLSDIISGSKARKVLIDHHLNPDISGFDVVISEIEISSACELFFWVLLQMCGDVFRLSMGCAEALFSGMLTDTNNFSNSVYPSTLRMAALLLERGVDKDVLQDRIMNCYIFRRMQLMGHLLKDKMTFIEGLDASYMLLSNEEKRSYDFKPGDSEGFVNLPLSIRRVRIAALFTEDSSGEYIRVSLRSKGDFDVNLLARAYFNGGGHKNASGGRLYMRLDDVPAYFEISLKLYKGIG